MTTIKSVYCPGCGELCCQDAEWNRVCGEAWLGGGMLLFRCADCALDLIVLLGDFDPFSDEQEIVMVFSEPTTENFITNAGYPVYVPDEIPF